MMTACTPNGQKSGDHSGEKESKAASVLTDESGTSTEQSSNPKENSGENQTNGKMHTLTVRDSGKSSQMTAGFINTMSGASEAVPMKKTDETADYVVFSCEGDTGKYNMVHLDYGVDQSTKDVAFNRFVSGWSLKEGILDPYIVGREPSKSVRYETRKFSFDGSDKNVYIWTPDDYDANAAEKYSTIYCYDGQWVLTDEITGDDNYPWSVGEHVASMMAQTDQKAIVVAIETPEANRTNELIPDIGEVAIKNYPTTKRGSALADFVCETVVPYVRSNYNVYTDAEHTGIVGSSLGGLESLCTGMAHPDVFGTIGALSPAFWAYNIKTWAAFLMPKLALNNPPYVYIYSGGYENDAGAYAVMMNNALIQYGYPKDRISCSIYQPGEHLSVYLHNMFPEFLQAMFEHKVSALENGALVPVPDEVQKQLQNSQNEAGDESREPTDKDYVYYDNSETKWEKVCAYWWGPYGSSTMKMTCDEYYDHPWPGLEMERIGETDLYRVIAPRGAAGIIFDNGVSDKVMSEENKAYQTADITYSQNVNPGQVYKIDMTKEPKAGKGIEKVKFRYPAGAWTDYQS